MEELINTNSAPHFNTPVQVEIIRFPNGEQCQMISLDPSTEISDQDLEQIAKVCSEERIYNLLFKRVFNGKPYTKSDAESYVNKSKQKWADEKGFVFFIRNPENKIIAAIDIKSPDLESAEIGYWASETFPGIMTNTVLALCDLARDAGYKSLFALIIPENQKSINLISRAEFVQDGELDRDDRHYQVYRKTL